MKQTRASRVLIFLLLAHGGLLMCACRAQTSRDKPNGAASASVSPARPFELKPCSLPESKVEARCGKYEVFEDRAERSGRRIALNVVVVPAQNPQPQPDPVFWFSGGPGEGATALAGQVGDDFLGRIHRERDLVFVDVRGTGDSNPLRCKLFGDGDDPAPYLADLFPIEKVRECRTQLERVANLALYTTPDAVDDIDEVRAALQYERINLYGGSYGTRVALAYLRQHPRRARAAVLSGVAPPDFKMPLPFARAAQHSLDALMDACAADDVCRKAFPNLRAEFATVLARLDKEPAVFEIVDPATKLPRRVTMPRGMFAERVRTLLYSHNFSRMLPLLIHRAYLGDYAPFGMTASSLARLIGDGVSMGMYLSVTCAEDVPAITGTDIARATAGTFLGDFRMRSHIAACREWPRGKVPGGFTEAVKSDAPVLMFSGEFDPATPRWEGERVVRLLLKGRQVIIPGGAHEYQSKCVHNLAAAFIEKGTSHALDASCVEQPGRPPFATELPKELFPGT